MDYVIREFSIEELVRLIDQKKVDLKPSYQRNFIWSTNDQSALIDTIIKKIPMPNFFLYEKENGTYEMIDGQQRSTTIYRFVKGIISSSKSTGKLSFDDCEEVEILNYRLPFVVVSNLLPDESLNSFYVLINKTGKNLNNPEVHKSEFSDTKFMQLANDVLTYQNFIDLNLFTDASSRRMNDRDFVQELLIYLKLGIRDKKLDFDKVFSSDIDNEEYQKLKSDFEKVIDIIREFNDIQPIKSTRYKQKNDFYTLFNFVDKNKSEDTSVLKYQYKILSLLSGIDSDGNQHIRPTNEECEILKEYAINCVSQSNSKKARENRLKIFDAILKNESYEPNESLLELLEYLSETYESSSIDLTSVGKYKLLDIEKLN